MIISLFLDRNNIGDVGVKYLSKRNWSNLTKLDLSAKLNYDQVLIIYKIMVYNT